VLNSAKRPFSPLRGGSREKVETQHIEENADLYRTHVVFFGAAGAGDDRQIRDHQKSDLHEKRKELLPLRQ